MYKLSLNYKKKIARDCIYSCTRRLVIIASKLIDLRGLQRIALVKISILPFLALNQLLLFAAYFLALYRQEKFLLTRQLFWSTSEIFQGQKGDILLGMLQLSTVTISKVGSKKKFRS